MMSGIRTASVKTTLAAILLLSSCNGGDGDVTDTTSLADMPVSEIAAILADPIAATDCELTPSGFPTAVCNYKATEAAEALGDKGDPAGVPALAAAIQDPDTYYETNDASWAALEKIGGPEVVAVLVDAITAVTVAGFDQGEDPQRGHTLSVAERAAGTLGSLGGVEHNRLLAEAGHNIFGCQSTGYFDALVMINKADATPLVALLEEAAPLDESTPNALPIHPHRWVYGPLIAIGQSGTEYPLVATLTEEGDKDMAECFLNSKNPALEQAAEGWAAEHGFTITMLPGGGAQTWGSG